MTTIVYHNGVLAADSRATCGEVIVNDDFNKLIIVSGVVFAMSGATFEYDDMINAYFGKEYSRDVSIAGIVLDKNEAYQLGINKDDGYWKSKITGETRAIGSGSDFAYTAIDMGCDAVKAVKMAMKRDTLTGGKVRVKKLKVK